MKGVEGSQIGLNSILNTYTNTYTIVGQLGMWPNKKGQLGRFIIIRIVPSSFFDRAPEKMIRQTRSTHAHTHVIWYRIRALSSPWISFSPSDLFRTICLVWIMPVSLNAIRLCVFFIPMHYTLDNHWVLRHDGEEWSQDSGSHLKREGVCLNHLHSCLLRENPSFRVIYDCNIQMYACFACVLVSAPASRRRQGKKIAETSQIKT